MSQRQAGFGEQLPDASAHHICHCQHATSRWGSVVGAHRLGRVCRVLWWGWSRGRRGPRAPPRPSRPQGARAAAVGRRTDPAQASPPPQAAGLLYMCQKCPRPRSENIEGREWRATDALGLRFPSPALVTSAAALFERAEPWANGRTRLGVEPESGRFRITVGPGVVRLGWTKPRPRREKQPSEPSNTANWRSPAAAPNYGGACHRIPAGRSGRRDFVATEPYGHRPRPNRAGHHLLVTQITLSDVPHLS